MLKNFSEYSLRSGEAEVAYQLKPKQNKGIDELKAPTDSWPIFLLVDSWEYHRVAEAYILRDFNMQVIEACDAVVSEQAFERIFEARNYIVAAIINSRIEAGKGGEELGYLQGYEGTFGNRPDPINGPRLAGRLLNKKPNLQILFILSPNTTSEVVLTALREEYPGLNPEAVTFLQRDFDSEKFRTTIQEMLV